MSSPLDPSPLDPITLVHPDARALAAATAEREQTKQMHTYVANVQGLFEQIITELLLEQPKDPHAFLIQVRINASTHHFFDSLIV